MKISIAEIVEGVSTATGYSIEEIHSCSRKRELALARQLCHYIAFKQNIYTDRHIGENIGNKDRTTVIHSVEMITAFIKNNDHLLNDYLIALNKKAPLIYSIMTRRKLTSIEPCNPTSFYVTRCQTYVSGLI